jgi:putative ABC transport system substrate-binding protein
MRTVHPGIGRRLLFRTLGGSALAYPLGASAQTAAKLPRIGFLYPGVSAAAPARVAALRDGLRAAGYAEADKLEVVIRTADGDPSRMAALAAELVALKVDAIVAVSPSGVAAAKAATSVIPIVAYDLESDPIRSGFATSLARPGGNITGVFSDFPNFGMKWLEFLKEALPSFSRAVVLWDPATGRQQLEAVQAAAKLLKVELEVLEIHAMAELAGLFAKAAEKSPDAVILLSSPIFGTEPKLIADIALAHHLATATLFPEIARAGGFIGYGPNLLDTVRQAGTVLAKVLQGARPADVPIERPTKFETVINMKTAKALGLSPPPALLMRADEVIE